MSLNSERPHWREKKVMKGLAGETGLQPQWWAALFEALNGTCFASLCKSGSALKHSYPSLL